jgi:hypothetical protein
MYLGDDSALPVWHVVRVGVQFPACNITYPRRAVRTAPHTDASNVSRSRLRETVIAHNANATMTQFRDSREGARRPAGTGQCGSEHLAPASVLRLLG